MKKEKIMSGNKTFDITPGTELINTIAHAGYTLESAVADIIDNSITANAKNIDIRFQWDDDLSNCYVEIIDDGYGMTSRELEEAMILSHQGMLAKRKDTDLGKFGLGLKTASLSQCNCLTVISKKVDHDITAKRIDQSYVSKNKAWQGIDLDGSKLLEQYDMIHGTIVRWDELTFLVNGKNGKKFFYEALNRVQKYVEMCFHRFIDREQIVITINGNKHNKLVGWNPIYKHEGTKTLANSEIKYKEHVIKMKSILLPSSVQCSEQEIKEMFRDSHALDYQGFFVYRNDRMLKAGGWLDLKDLNQHQKYNPVRIIVDMPSKLDEDFKVDFTKATLDFPQDIQVELTKFARQARAALKQKRDTHHINVEKKIPIWIQKEKKDGIELSVNMDHPIIQEIGKDIDSKKFKMLLKLLSNSVPQITNKININYSDDEIIKYMHIFYGNEKFLAVTDSEIRQKMNNIQPFNEHPELIRYFFEEVIKHD